MKHFEGTAEAEALSGTVVQLANMGVQLLRCDPGQVGALGQILTQQTIGVLVGPSFPGMIRMSKINMCR